MDSNLFQGGIKMNVNLSLRTLTNQAILQNMFQTQMSYQNATPGMMKNMFKIGNPLQDYMTISEEALKKLSDAREAQAKERSEGKKSTSAAGSEQEELTVADAMRSIPLNVKYIDYIPPASTEEMFDYGTQRISDILNYKGLQLEDGEEMTLTIENNRIKVNGLANQEKQAQIEEALNKVHVTRDSDGYVITHNITIASLESMYRLTTDYAKSAETFDEARAKAGLIGLKDNVGDMSELTGGIAVDWSKLSKDENGKVHGLPPQLEWAFDVYHDNLAPTNALNMKAIMIARPIHTLLDAGYDSIPDLGQDDMKFSYSAKGGLKAL
jgi:hypothetical protein